MPETVAPQGAGALTVESGRIEAGRSRAGSARFRPNQATTCATALGYFVGFRIELGEIEAALGAHDAVRQCVVMARADDGGEQRLVAYLVGDATPVAALRAHLGESLPDYMIPSAFVWLDAIPLTPNGKVDRNALPAPELDREALSAGFVAPRTATEAALAAIWAEVLGLDAVGVQDDFFELGGDSILSILVVSRAARQGVVITPRQLFERPTVRGLATVADGAEGPGGAIHHLVVDGVSWRVLIDDVERACDAIARGAAVDLGPKTTSWRRWAEAQCAWVSETDRSAEIERWRSMLEAPIAALPMTSQAGEPSHRFTVVELDAEKTEALLRRAGRAYRTEINDLLLTALALALRDWTGGPAVGVCLEGHGREQAVLGGLDVSRTVGWFTTMFPVRLVPGGGIGDTIEAVKAQLRAVPSKGMTHGMLRWLGEAEHLVIPAGYGVLFNYLGQLSSGRTGLGLDGGPAGLSIGRGNHSTSSVAFNAMVRDGRLQMRVDWDGARFAEGVVERLATAFVEALEGVIAHCVHAAPVGSAAMAEVSSEGLTLAALDWGTPGGPPVLCLHGRLDHAGSWAPVAERLAVLGAYVRAIDLRGHGHASHAPGYDWPGFAADGLAALSTLGEEPVVLVGHSLGAGLALTLRMLAPHRVRHLVLIEPELEMAPGTALDLLRARMAVSPDMPAMRDLAEARRRARRALPEVDEALIEARVNRLTRSAVSGVTWRWDGRLLAGGYPGTPRRGTLLSWLAEGSVPLDWIRATQGAMVGPDDLTAVRGAGAHIQEHVLDGLHHIHLQRPERIAEIVARRALAYGARMSEQCMYPPTSAVDDRRRTHGMG